MGGEIWVLGITSKECAIEFCGYLYSWAVCNPGGWTIAKLSQIKGKNFSRLGVVKR